jgi:hypothetical protein
MLKLTLCGGQEPTLTSVGSEHLTGLALGEIDLAPPGTGLTITCGDEGVGRALS